MPVLLLLLLPIIEITVLIQIGARIGFVNTVFALVVAGILGAGLARTQGRYILMKMQTSLARGEVPANQVIHGLLVFVAGILFLVPGFVTDIVALFLVLPGTRHIIAAYVKNRLASAATRGGFRVFTSAGNPFGGFGGFGTASQQQQQRSQNPFRRETDESSFARDVSPKVIDVTPIVTETREKPDGDNSGPVSH